ncbi:hypothetical protein [Kingella oralis]|uniref:hypothetical protein n=1 Tax=Kingella oralis TaxID=505 RepID=UPI002D7F5AB4|nr:hypothetical protein [Kingella oralis]
MKSSFHTFSGCLIATRQPEIQKSVYAVRRKTKTAQTASPTNFQAAHSKEMAA